MLAAVKQAITGNFDKIVSSFCEPWKKWWGKLTGIFKSFSYEAGRDEKSLTENPFKSADDVQAKTTTSVRSLGMKGMTAESNLKQMDKLLAMSGYQGKDNMLKRIQGMNERYNINFEQADSYNRFI